MKLASFYGLTAPQIVMLADEIGLDHVIALSKKMENSVDCHRIVDVKNELYYLYDTLRQIRWVYTGPEVEPYTEDEKVVRVVAGNCGNEELQLKLQRNLILLTVKALLSERFSSNIAFDRFGDLSPETIKMTIANAVVECIKSRNFIIQDSEKMATMCARRFFDPQAKLSTQGLAKLAEAYKMKRSCPQEFIVDGKKVHLKDEDCVVLKYLLERLGTVQQLYLAMHVSTTKSAMVFDTPFADFVNRNPARILKIIVLQRWKTIQYTKKEHFFRKAFNDLAEQLVLFNQLIDENVMTPGQKKGLYGLEKKDALEIARECYAMDFYNEFVAANVISIENLDASTFRMLIDLYQHLNQFSPSAMNKKFGLRLSRTEWEDVFERLSTIGIYCFNFYTEQLFKECLAGMTLNSYTHVVISEEGLERIKESIHEVKSLLETLRAIGDDVNEELIHF